MTEQATAIPPLVRLRGVKKRYRRGDTQIPVLEGIDLDVPQGAFVALMGPSGSGKSTLLNLIAGLDKADAGTVEVAGVELTALGERELAAFRARHVGFVFQSFNLIPVLSALENVELPLLLTSLPAAERAARARAALEAVGMGHRARHRPHQLSGGEEQRVAIARAIVSDPSIIVADEPTGELDRRSAEQVLDLLDGLHERGKTVLMVTHDPRAAERGHQVHRLDKGVLQ